MVKKIKTRKPKNAQTQSQLVSAEQMSIAREIEYIIGRAQEGDARVVSLAKLILFSTHTGDAWILDAEDKTALCLAKSGERQDFKVAETSSNFRIEWTYGYQIEGDYFTVIDHSGQIRSITGYPVCEIAKAEGRAT